MNTQDSNKLVTLEKPFRMQKLNLIWEKAVKKLPVEKLKLLHTDLKFQDKDELELKRKKSEGQDKNGLKEGLVLASFKAILEKYQLQDDFKALQDAAMVSKPSKPEMPNDAYVKNVFRDKKLNKLWLKAEQQGFSEEQLQTLKEEFEHHQNKIDQYDQMINQVHAKTLEVFAGSQDENLDNTVEHVIQAEVGDKFWKSENPYQILKEKHSQLKSGYEYLNTKIMLDIRNTEFDNPQVNSLWEMAKNASFSPKELESLKNELHHFEHRIRKLKTLTALEMETDDSNMVDEVAFKRQKKLKEYNYKVEKIQKELTSRILQKHIEL
ncbi:hypothetical protein JTE90_008990 [Oedothorax gibbosus]|uniref:Alpha-2-macroglobulin receptor-associated protein n=1 Tax=Oedothorax gibbosus TaxID=931172 RepID=A0AAV6UM49_9ARAC|nr:hypothetical protein JTE90_008990 [Oedothorax gibbosus]